VQPQKLYTFIAAARAYQTRPSEAFFFPPKTHAASPDILAKQIATRGSAFVFLFIGELDAVPDVLWGQLYRTKRSLRTLLETHGYNVLQDAVWSNERLMSAFVFELEQQKLPNIKKHLGPPLERGVECERFLAKYVADKTVLAGPYIEDGHWVVEVPRKNVDAVALLYGKLGDGGKHAGVADLISQAIQDRLEILVNGEVLKVYVEHSDFAVFLTEFLSSKPFWLETH
jgi:tRNA nucleotidyltransferase (CCA-adding enzyme)